MTDQTKPSFDFDTIDNQADGICCMSECADPSNDAGVLIRFPETSDERDRVMRFCDFHLIAITNS